MTVADNLGPLFFHLDSFCHQLEMFPMLYTLGSEFPKRGRWAQVAGACSERQKMFHGGSFLKLADDNMDIQNPEAQNRELSGF